jgi:hypothetical protein
MRRDWNITVDGVLGNEVGQPPPGPNINLDAVSRSRSSSHLRHARPHRRHPHRDREQERRPAVPRDAYYAAGTSREQLLRNRAGRDRPPYVSTPGSTSAVPFPVGKDSDRSSSSSFPGGADHGSGLLQWTMPTDREHGSASQSLDSSAVSS